MTKSKLTIVKKDGFVVLKPGEGSPKGFKCTDEEAAMRLATSMGLAGAPPPPEPVEPDPGDKGDKGDKGDDGIGKDQKPSGAKKPTK